jgi:hypothetical protein
MGRPGDLEPVEIGSRDPMGRLLNPIFHEVLGGIPTSIKAEFEEEARERREKLDREAAERRRREGGG